MHAPYKIEGLLRILPLLLLPACYLVTIQQRKKGVWMLFLQSIVVKVTFKSNKWWYDIGYLSWIAH